MSTRTRGSINYNYKKIAKVREELKLTQAYVADTIGLVRNIYSRKERGIILISLDEAYKISNVLGMSMEELFFQD